MAQIVIPVVAIALQVLQWSLRAKPKQIPPKMPSSDYGRNIPRIYGKMRVGVNWFAPQEDGQIFRKGKSGKGKGGGGGKQKQNKYYLYIGGLVCEGPITITSVQVNEKKYNGGGPIVFVNGDANQPANSLLLGLGADAKYQIGYRKLAYLVFQDFNLEDYGNSIPSNVTAFVEGFYLNSGTVKVKDICQDILTSSGIPSNQIVNLIPDGLTCYGAIAQRGGESYYDLLSQLLRCYSLYLYLDDSGRLVIRNRAQNAIALSIAQTALLPFEEDGEEVLLGCRIGNDEDLLGSLTLEFYDINENYDKNTVRAYNPNGSIENELSFQVEIVMTSSEATLYAQNVLMQEWLEKKYTYRFSLPPQYIGMVKVGELVEILPEGLVLQVVSLSIGVDYTTEVEAVIYQDFDNLTSLNIITDARPDNIFEDPFATPTDLVLLDFRLISDFDNDIAIYPFSNKDFSVLYMSLDGGISYPFEQNISQSAPMGTALNILGNIDTPYLFDKKNTLTVEFANGEVDQQTLDDLYRDNTILFVGKVVASRWVGEFVGYVEAELTGVNTYTFRYLKRGIRNTEVFINQHIADEKVIVVKSPFFGADQVGLDLSLLSQNLKFKLSPTNFQTDISGLPVTDLNYQGRSLNPYPPLAVVEKNPTTGDFTIRVFNRGRKYAELKDNTDIIQVDTPVVLRVRLSPGGRVFEYSGTEGVAIFTYTAAQQIDDTGSLLDELFMQTAQVSSVVGEIADSYRTYYPTKLVVS